MVIPGLADAVTAAIKSYAGQERTPNRQARRRSIDERLTRTERKTGLEPATLTLAR